MELVPVDVTRTWLMVMSVVCGEMTLPVDAMLIAARLPCEVLDRVEADDLDMSSRVSRSCR